MIEFGADLMALLPTIAWESWLKQSVETAIGPLGLGIIAIYSFLIAVVLPTPSETVLVPVLSGHMVFFGSQPLSYIVVMAVSGGAKAAGSVFALRLGHGVKESGPVIRLLRRSPIDIVAWSERKTIQLAERYGFVGLAAALSVPFFPDTLSIYAFTVLEEDYRKFALATFAGSVGRLVVTLVIVYLGLGVVSIPT
ncbi:MAG: YqaA family protein [Halococcoides sp.]